MSYTETVSPILNLSQIYEPFSSVPQHVISSATDRSECELFFWVGGGGGAFPVFLVPYHERRGTTAFQISLALPFVIITPYLTSIFYLELLINTQN
jgi:hypothetical protein